ncbi:hypothetical protein [Phenylobacterium aquaticum]|uniref:hypothetical protein n=1 Tax=Phenylobacterium aquaticum TaxID=1763816 RepID=UPI0026EF6817|nr:hypothetical protein [Phenylobacterium aquaticum]
MTRPRLTLGADTVARWLLGAGFLVMLALSLPGQMTYDSLAQLHEGRVGQRETWGPAAYAAVLGFFDHLSPGPGLYVTASGFLAFAALISLIRLRPRTSWWGVAAAGLLVLSPALLIYQGIVWKDVLFANLAVAGFALLARIARDWTPGARPWLALAGLVLLLALAAQVRQNGLVVAPIAAAVMAWTVRGEGRQSSLTWGLGGLVVVIAASAVMGWLAEPTRVVNTAENPGLRILQQYDIIGVAAHDPKARLKDIAAVSPAAEEVIRHRATRLYSAERVDYLGSDPIIGHALWRTPAKVIAAQWRDVILRYPGPYLRHRASVFRWVFLTPAIDSCSPVTFGVAGPPALAASLEIPLGQDPTDRSLGNYASWLIDTPVFSHLTYALIALATAGVLMVRRQPQDVAIAGLMVSALGFAASFFVISLACDYRYLYFLDLAALAGLFYLALDPPLAELGLERRP